MSKRTYLCGMLFCLFPLVAAAQPAPDMQKVLERLDQLEQENHKLLDEIQALRREVSQSHAGEAPTATVEERVDIAEKRIEELAQTKVEASQRFPISVTGMLLFNAYDNGANGGGAQNPVVAGLVPSPSRSGRVFAADDSWLEV